LTDVLSYLSSKNIEYKREGNEVLIVCPYCGKQKLSININTGVYKCWKCQAENPESPYVKGHISQLQKEWGDVLPISSPFSNQILKKEESESDFTELAIQQHSNIWNHPSAIKYLFKRGFNEEDIKRFKFGYDVSLGEEWVSIPSFEAGKSVLIKYRKITDNHKDVKKNRREAGGKSILYNGDILKDRSFLEKYNNEIYIAEGEWDCCTMLKHGYENTVGMTVGAGTLKEDWYDDLIQVQRINLILDPDSVGQGSAENVWAKRLGYSRCWNVLLPEGYDINDYFLKFDKDSFDIILASAAQFKIKGVISLQEAFYEMYKKGKNTEQEQVFPLPWESINKKLQGGFRRGRLTVLSGTPGSGKTSMAMQICYHYASQGIPCFIFCMEMPEVELATKIVQLKYDLTIQEVSYNNALSYENDLKDFPLYLGYSSKVTPEIFYNTMIEVRNRYGVEFGVFDNFHRLIRTGKEAEEGKASGMFKDITMDLNIPFLLIGQPRKRNQEQESSTTFVPTRESIKGSSSIPADADEVIIIHRKRLLEDDGSSTFDSKTQIILDKSRYSAGGIVTLNFVGEKSRFDEIIT